MIVSSTLGLTVSVRAVQAAASATATELAAAATSASIPITEVEYIELASVGYADTSGQYRFITEIALVVDALRINTHKSLADTQAFADQAAKQPRKLATDSLSLDDRMTRASGKGLADQFAFSEVLAKALATIASDSAAPVDAKSITTSHPVASAFTLADASTHAAQKGVADSVALAEFFNSVLVFIREAADVVAATDRPAILFTPTAKSDGVAIADEALRIYSKSLSDAFALDDGTAVGDGSTYFFEKTLNNIVSMLDARFSLVSKTSTDQFTTSESGLVSAQGYCDITYFAEDYVGTSTTF